MFKFLHISHVIYIAAVILITYENNMVSVSFVFINDISRDSIIPNIDYENIDKIIELKPKSNLEIISTWFNFMEILTKTANRALKNIYENIQNNLDLDPNNKRLLEELLKNTDDFDNKLIKQLKNIFAEKQFDTSTDTIFETMNRTISLLNNVVKTNLDHMKLTMPTKWYNHMKNKMIRQEMKAATGYIERKMCNIHVCKKLKSYSEFVTNWIRYLLNLKAVPLHEFLIFLPDTLEKYKHFIKTNVKFRKTIKYFINSDVVIQKDNLAFLDDIIENPEIYRVIPNDVKKLATMLLLFKNIIDVNYNVNEENKMVLDNITKKFGEMMDGVYVYIPGTLDMMIENLQINFKIWPLKEQSKLENLWAEIIQ